MGEIQDGSAVFQILDKRKEKVRQEYVDLVYPVGIVVAIANDKKPAFMQYGTWEKVAEDRVLQGSSDSHAPGTKIEAGIPNLSGWISYGASGDGNDGVLFSPDNSSSARAGTVSGGGGRQKMNFNASKYNKVYGNSDTVQPPAYVVDYWQRTK